MYLKMYSVTKVYIENASYFSGSKKGQMVADSGKLVVLAKYVGSLEAICHMMEVEFESIDVIKWKGNLPKEVVNDRIKAIWPECDCKSHDWDAVGLGMYIMGLINR
jgi:hypothetical protein